MSSFSFFIYWVMLDFVLLNITYIFFHFTYFYILNKSHFNLLLNKQTRYSNSRPDGECFRSSTCSAAWIFAFNKFIKNESLQIVFYPCLHHWHVMKLSSYSSHLMLLNIRVCSYSELVRVPLTVKGEGKAILQCYSYYFKKDDSPPGIFVSLLTIQGPRLLVRALLFRQLK